MRNILRAWENIEKQDLINFDETFEKEIEKEKLANPKASEDYIQTMAIVKTLLSQYGDVNQIEYINTSKDGFDPQVIQIRVEPDYGS